MSYQIQSFGMMDEGYFVPRGQIIGWINSLLKVNITKIEQLGAGNIYCQILDIIYPGKVALNKVNWRAKLQYEFINNLKILQNSFDKLGIKKHLQIQKISKAKYQDNLQLIQWFKRYYDLNCGERGNNYQAQQRRGGIVPDFSFADKTIVPKLHGSTTNLNTNLKQKPKKVSQVVLEKSPIQKSPIVEKPMIQKQKIVMNPFTDQAPIILRKTKQQEKLEMIEEIVRNPDESYQEKIKLIEEVLNIDF